VCSSDLKVLVTQVFADDDERLATDVTFSVADSLVGRFARQPQGASTAFRLDFDLVLQAGDTVFPAPPIP
jgi:catechol 1,2-dioxygenase